MKNACVKCGIIQYGIEDENIPLCSLCKREFRQWYEDLITLLPKSSRHVSFYEETKKIWINKRP